MPARSLAPFLLLVAVWFLVTSALWWLATPILAWPVALLSELVARAGFGGWVQGVEQQNEIITFVTSLKPADAGYTSGAKNILLVPSNIRLFSFGLPLLAALILATREPHVIRRLLIGYVVLLPFQTFSVVSDFLKNIAIEAGPGVTAQLRFTAAQLDVIAFCYQFGTLILPTVAPAIVWVLMHRHLLENFAGRDLA
jgi:hypothetical protein